MPICSATASTPNDRPIAGRAVVITVPSSISMKKAPATSRVTARVRPGGFMWSPASRLGSLGGVPVGHVG